MSKRKVTLQTPEDLNAKLLELAATGTKEEIKLLLKAGADVRALGVLNRTPLHFAAAYNNIDAIKLFLKKNPNINAQDTNGDTPLHAAAKSYSLEAVKILLRKETDPNIENNEGDTALHYAAHTNITFATPANITSTTPDEVAHELEQKNLLIVEHLCKKTRIVRNNRGYSPIWGAVFSKKWKTVQLLQQYGDNICSKDNGGSTLLHYAIIEKQFDVIHMFVTDYPDELATRNNQNDTPFMLAIINYDGTTEARNVIKFLLGEKHLISPAHREVFHDLFLNPKVDHELIDLIANRLSQLVIAANNGESRSLDYFINGKNDQDMTPLHIAAILGDVEKIRFLLSLGANPFFTSNTNMTAADYAATNPNATEAIKVLALEGHSKPDIGLDPVTRCDRNILMALLCGSSMNETKALRVDAYLRDRGFHDFRIVGGSNYFLEDYLHACYKLPLTLLKNAAKAAGNLFLGKHHIPTGEPLEYFIGELNDGFPNIKRGHDSLVPLKALSCVSRAHAGWVDRVYRELGFTTNRCSDHVREIIKRRALETAINHREAALQSLKPSSKEEMRVMP